MTDEIGQMNPDIPPSDSRMTPAAGILNHLVGHPLNQTKPSQYWVSGTRVDAASSGACTFRLVVHVVTNYILPSNRRIKVSRITS